MPCKPAFISFIDIKLGYLIFEYRTAESRFHHSNPLNCNSSEKRHSHFAGCGIGPFLISEILLLDALSNQVIADRSS